MHLKHSNQHRSHAFCRPLKTSLRIVSSNDWIENLFCLQMKHGQNVFFYNKHLGGVRCGEDLYYIEFVVASSISVSNTLNLYFPLRKCHLFGFL